MYSLSDAGDIPYGYKARGQIKYTLHYCNTLCEACLWTLRSCPLVEVGDSHAVNQALSLYVMRLSHTMQVWVVPCGEGVALSVH